MHERNVNVRGSLMTDMTDSNGLASNAWLLLEGDINGTISNISVQETSSGLVGLS